MSFKITGNSGCQIELLEEYGKPFVRKMSLNGDYRIRLVLQAEKQQRFFAFALPDGFNVPAVFGIHQDNEISWFDMEYVNATDYISFFEHANTTDISGITQKLCGLVDGFLMQSELLPFPVDAFMDKHSKVRQAIALNPLSQSSQLEHLLNKSEKFFASSTFDCLLPIGQCHGDLTFSNMLIHNAQHITLIDMLDSFIETPLQDIAKLRQDSFFFWSLLFFDGDFNRLRMQSIMRKVDAMIDAHCQQYPFYHAYYKLFQVMNLMRILPYAKQPHVVDSVCDALATLLEV